MAIKGAVEDNPSFEPKEVEAKFPSNNDALKLFTFKDYVTALQAKRVCTDVGFTLPSFNFGRRDLQDLSCDDTIGDHELCIFQGVCECEELVNMEGSTGCGGELISADWPSLSINEVCPSYCGACGDEIGEDLRVVQGSDDEGPLCADLLSSSPLCFFGELCDCQTVLDSEFSEGCGGDYKDPLWGDTDINDICPLTCGVCKEGEPAPVPKSSLGISGIAPNGRNWQVPFVKCDGRLCEQLGADASGLCEYLALAIAPSTSDDTVGLQQAEAFRDYIYSRYPVLANNSALPFDFDFIQMMESDEEVETYVKAENYGVDVPKLALAVVFNGQDTSINYNYAIRSNSTGFNSPDDEGRPATLTTPPTDKLFERYARTDTESCPELVGGTPDLGPYSNSCTGRYAYNGLLTIQRLVHDFIIEDSGAAAKGFAVSEGGVTFASMPSPGFVEQGKSTKRIVSVEKSYNKNVIFLTHIVFRNF